MGLYYLFGSFINDKNLKVERLELQGAVFGAKGCYRPFPPLVGGSQTSGSNGVVKI